MTQPAGPAWLEGDTVRSSSASDTENRWRGIFAELAEGRLVALDELYDLASADVYRLALWRTGSREDAEDVVQDVFIRVAEQGPRLASIRHPKRWLLTVTHRCAIDLIRRNTRRRTEPVDEAPYLEAVREDPDLALEAERVSRQIHRLPAKQREVILLRHFADCSFREIGRITGVPTFTAASRHRLAVTRLRRLLEDHHEPTA